MDVFLEKLFPVSKKLNKKNKLNHFVALPGVFVSSSCNRLKTFIRNFPNRYIIDELL